jgi:ATP-dependent DNA helicase PIF1
MNMKETALRRKATSRKQRWKQRSGPEIELNDRFRQALKEMENTRKNVFITGRAGTGKSTLLSHFRNTTKKQAAVLAPSGVAALNVKGQTIHSFFGFKPNITRERVKNLHFVDDEKNIYKKLDAIVIDEISMVRADLIDCVDRFLRLNGPTAKRPFGGLQMIFFGDLYQLPPVVAGAEKEVFGSFYSTPYFYSAEAFDSMEMEFIELEKVYRQHDEQFLSLLNSIRNNSITEEELAILNQRYLPEFEPPPDSFYIHLTTTNKLADQINAERLAKLPGISHVFPATIQGDFGEKNLPTSMILHLKAGAQIMMVNNDPDGRWVNGSIAKVTSIIQINREDYVIFAEMTNGEEVEIAPYTWEIFRFFVEEGQLQSETIGTFRQYPLILAWAVTIHKSQGKTFDRVIIDIGQGAFSHGQVYVALSRCTTLEGIALRKPIKKKHIWSDYRIVDFLTRYQYKRAAEICSIDDKLKIIERAIENETPLRIVYLKPNDEKSQRTVRPETVGEMVYHNKTYLGMQAFCLKRNAERVFRVDRILEIEEARE